MLEMVRNADRELLLFFNSHNNQVLDFLFYWISDKWIWIPFYAWLAWLLLRKYSIDFIFVMIFVAIAITLSDQLASSVIKEHVMRLRPCHEPSIMARIHLVNNYCGGRYGFISSHAANVFTLAAFITRILHVDFKGFGTIIWIWAAIVSYSRVYLGVHYPADVVVAALLGIIIGSLCAKLFISTVKKYSLNKINRQAK